MKSRYIFLQWSGNFFQGDELLYEMNCGMKLNYFPAERQQLTILISPPYSDIRRIARVGDWIILNPDGKSFFNQAKHLSRETKRSSSRSL